MNTIKFLGIAATATDRESLVKRDYGFYERLCMGKHGNPIAERNRYFARAQDGRTRLVFTPVHTSGRVKEAKIGLLIASRAVGMGLWAYLHAHARDASDIRERLLRTMEQTRALMSALKESDAA